jgi:hypothetical protein
MSSWFSRFNKVWASKGLLDDPTDAQAEAGWAYIGQAPPTVEQFNATHQWWDYKDNWLYNQIAAVINSVGGPPNETDVNQLLNAIRSQQRKRLTVPITIYVNSTSGNDSNTGATGSPFRTINRALNYIHNDIDQGGQQVTIQLASGVYDPVAVGTPNQGLIAINGDRANPGNYMIKNTNGPAVNVSSGAQLWLQGISIEATGGTTGVGLQSSLASAIFFMDVAFGPCSYLHLWGTSGGTVTMPGGGLSYRIYGGGYGHFQAAAAGVVTIATAIVTIQNNPIFSSAFAISQTSGTGQVWGMTFSGTAQGARYLADSNSVINSLGAGANYLPGTTPGVTVNGGIYI